MDFKTVLIVALLLFAFIFIDGLAESAGAVLDGFARIR